jgi:hypothetical protein
MIDSGRENPMGTVRNDRIKNTESPENMAPGKIKMVLYLTKGKYLYHVWCLNISIDI